MYKKCEEILNKLESEEKIKISNYQFPPKQELKLKLKDMLEDEVDEKYYLSEKMIKYISATGTANFRNPDSKINLDIARPLTTDQNKRAGTTNYLSKELPNNFDLHDYILIKEATKQGYKEAFKGDGVNINSRMKYQRGNVQKESIQTLTTSGGNDRAVVTNDLRIRKLTPKESWRLMGFSDKDFEKTEKVNSNTQLYKQAGNSICVPVLEGILRSLLLKNEGDK